MPSNGDIGLEPIGLISPLMGPVYGLLGGDTPLLSLRYSVSAQSRLTFNYRIYNVGPVSVSTHNRVAETAVLDTWSAWGMIGRALETIVVGFTARLQS